MQMLIAALFLIIKNCKQSKCPDERINKYGILIQWKTIHSQGTSYWYRLQYDWTSKTCQVKESDAKDHVCRYRNILELGHQIGHKWQQQRLWETSDIWPKEEGRCWACLMTWKGLKGTGLEVYLGAVSLRPWIGLTYEVRPWIGLTYEGEFKSLKL